MIDLNLTCKNLLSALGRQYEPLNFKLEVTDFIILIKMNLRSFHQRNWYGDDMFVAKFPEYELGFQRIVYVVKLIICQNMIL